MTATEDRCAYPDCQAGGVILSGAPRVVALTNDRYHPGCWRVMDPLQILAGVLVVPAAATEYDWAKEAK